MRLWEINLYEDDDAPIALVKLWALFAILKGGQPNEEIISFILDGSFVLMLSYFVQPFYTQEKSMVFRRKDY